MINTRKSSNPRSNPIQNNPIQDVFRIQDLRRAVITKDDDFMVIKRMRVYITQMGDAEMLRSLKEWNKRRQQSRDCLPPAMAHPHYRAD
jgi:hypothetical protein